MRLLGSVGLGRVVFTMDALPAIRPVNHLVDDGAVIIRSHLGAAITGAVSDSWPPGAVVAYEADSIDPDTHLGWSVVITGTARRIADPVEVARYERLIRPLVSQVMDVVIRISPEIIRGYRVVEDLGSPRSPRSGDGDHRQVGDLSAEK